MKLLFAGAGAVAVSATAIGAYFLNNGEQKPSGEPVTPKTAYLILKQDEDGSVSESAQDTKYYCEFNNAPQDKTCQLMNIKFDETKKSIDLDGLKKINEPIAKYSDINKSSDNKSSKNYYLLKTDNADLYTDIDKNNDLKIIEDGGSDSENETEFMILGKFDSAWNFTGKSSLMLVRPIADFTINSSSATNISHKCQIKINSQSQNEENDCLISDTQKTDIKEIDFLNLNDMLDTKTHKKENYFIFKFIGSAVDANNDLSKTQITYIHETTGDSSSKQQTEISTFDIKVLLIGQLDDEDEPKEVIILNSFNNQ